MDLKYWWKKMLRYAKQTDNFRCGPFALLNVLKWAGAREYKGAPINITTARTELADLCKCDEDGTGTMDFDKALRTLPEIKVKRVWKIKPGVLKKHLRKGGVAVVGFDYIEDDGSYGGHVSFFTEVTKTYLMCINHKNKTKYKMSHKEFRRMFYKKFSKPMAWLIDRDYKVGEIVKAYSNCMLVVREYKDNKIHMTIEMNDLFAFFKMYRPPGWAKEINVTTPCNRVERTTERERFLYHLFGRKALIEESIN